MRRPVEESCIEYIGQRIVITDDDIDWDGQGGMRLWENAETAITKGKYYYYGNDCLFDLHELRPNFRESPPGTGGYMYDYTIWQKYKGWFHPAFDYQGTRLYTRVPHDEPL